MTTASKAVHKIAIMEAESAVQIEGADVRMLCGKKGAAMSGTTQLFTLTDSEGNAFKATMQRDLVSCLRCRRSLEKADAFDLANRRHQGRIGSGQAGTA